MWLLFGCFVLCAKWTDNGPELGNLSGERALIALPNQCCAGCCEHYAKLTKTV